MSIIKKYKDESKVIAGKSIIDHSQLTGRNDYGCHPISAIRKLPEKLNSLKEKNNEILNNIDEINNNLSIIDNKVNQLNTSLLKRSIEDLNDQTQEIRNNTSNINMVDNKDTTFTFTDYNGNSKIIQSGALPDEETLELQNNKISLKNINTDNSLIGKGTSKEPLSINIDNNTIQNNGTLKVIALDNNGKLISASFIDSEITSLNQGIGDLTDTINNDKKELEAKNLEQDNLINALQNKTSGLGGYLTAYNFKTNTPTQEALTKYALNQLNLTEQINIPDQTRVKNLYDDNVWILNNRTQNETIIFNWVNDGSGEITIATNTTLGVIKGSTEDYQGSIDTLGHISINGLEEFIEGINQTLNDLDSLKANINADNINKLAFLSKLGLTQSFEEINDAIVIKLGNILLQAKNVSINGNTTYDFIFPYMYDKAPLCWCNSVEDGNSSNNSTSIIASDVLGMTARTCGANTKTTLFAIGWKNN